jgi:hypothetical protein
VVRRHAAVTEDIYPSHDMILPDRRCGGMHQPAIGRTRSVMEGQAPGSQNVQDRVGSEATGVAAVLTARSPRNALDAAATVTCRAYGLSPNLWCGV